MWSGQSKQATSAKMAIIYITAGALIDVWTVIYYIYLNRNGADFNAYLWCYGFFASGLVLMAVGLAVGWIGRSAMSAEVNPVPSQVVAPTAAAVAPAAAVTATGQPIVAATPVPPTPPPPVASVTRHAH